MNKIMYYSHEGYTVLSFLFVLFSAIFVQPDLVQAFSLGFIVIFCFHEWEENNYPGGFFELLFGTVARIPVDSTQPKLKEARFFTYTLIMMLTWTPYFAHRNTWLIFPVIYLALVEGVMHTIILPYLAGQKSHYTPGAVTAVIMFCYAIFVWFWLIHSGLHVALWQYLVALLLLPCGLAYMAIFGMRHNGIDPRTMPKNVKQVIAEKKAERKAK